MLEVRRRVRVPEERCQVAGGPDAAHWGGVVPAALTMFDHRGRLDLPASCEHLEYLLAEGADGVVVGGTSGEFVALSDRERLRLIEASVDVVRGRVPVIAGTGSYGTAT